MKGKIGVGISGIELGRGWAAAAHSPALRALPKFEVVASAPGDARLRRPPRTRSGSLTRSTITPSLSNIQMSTSSQ